MLFFFLLLRAHVGPALVVILLQPVARQVKMFTHFFFFFFFLITAGRFASCSTAREAQYYRITETEPTSCNQFKNIHTTRIVRADIFLRAYECLCEHVWESGGL